MSELTAYVQMGGFSHSGYQQPPADFVALRVDELLLRQIAALRTQMAGSGTEISGQLAIASDSWKWCSLNIFVDESDVGVGGFLGKRSPTMLTHIPCHASWLMGAWGQGKGRHAEMRLMIAMDGSDSKSAFSSFEFLTPSELLLCVAVGDRRRLIDMSVDVFCDHPVEIDMLFRAAVNIGCYDSVRCLFPLVAHRLDQALGAYDRCHLQTDGRIALLADGEFQPHQLIVVQAVQRELQLDGVVSGVRLAAPDRRRL